MTKRTDGRLILLLDFCVVGWDLYRHKKLTLKGLVRYFAKKGNSNVTETNLFVERRTETTSRPTNERPVCFIDAWVRPSFPYKMWLTSVRTPLVYWSDHGMMSGGSSLDSYQKQDIYLYWNMSRPPLWTHFNSQPTGEYFPGATTAGEQSWPHNPDKILIINTAIPTYPIMAHKLTAVTQSDWRHSVERLILDSYGFKPRP